MRFALLLPLVACAAPRASSPATAPAPAPPPPSYVLLEPTQDRHGELPVMRPLAQHADLDRTLARPYLRWVLALGDEMKRRGRARCGSDAACAKRFDQPAYFAIMKGGNRPKQGFALVEAGQTRDLPEAWYVEIDPASAATLIPHEYGHVMMFASLPGDLPQKPQTLPHTTGAITNDIVAFSEGWGIHFETIGGDRRDEPGFAALHRDTFTLGGELAKADSMVAVTDLFNYAQSYRRYTCVKENCFAYLPRVAESYVRDRKPTAEDVLARWTDTTVDPARVRSLPQLVASEGVIATLFYRLATVPGGDALPDPARYAAMFDAFARITEARAQTTPVVLVFLEALLDGAAPAERERIARIALDVLHYTPVAGDAPRLYAELHAAGHRLDKPAYQQRLARFAPEAERAVARLVAEPAAIATPRTELWLVNEAFRIDLPLLGMRQRPLVLDLQTAPVELLMTLPGVSYADAIAIDAARPLRSIAELAARGVRRDLVEALTGLASSSASRAGSGR